MSGGRNVGVCDEGKGEFQCIFIFLSPGSGLDGVPRYQRSQLFQKW